MMTVTHLRIPGPLLITPDIFRDDRGHFSETFNEIAFGEATGIVPKFVQDNHSFSFNSVIRGLHYQSKFPQGKLVRVAQGSIFDVIVDLRLSSPTYGQWDSVMLSHINRLQLWVPPGFAHGFSVNTDTADVLYKCTEYRHQEYERSLLWNDPDLGIVWPINGIPKVSQKDMEGVPLRSTEGYK